MTCMLAQTAALLYTLSFPYWQNNNVMKGVPVRLNFNSYRGASCSVPVTGCVLTASADGIISRVS